MAGFVAQLDRINALADRASGFARRLRDDSGNATLRPFGDPMTIVNLLGTSGEPLFDLVGQQGSGREAAGARMTSTRAGWLP